MKISIDGREILQLSPTQKMVIQNDIQEEIFESDMERRLIWVLTHKYEKCFTRLKEDWEKKLNGRVESIPLDKEKFSELVFSQHDYKNRSQRERESELEERDRNKGK